jgi:hypothetical protein
MKKFIFITAIIISCTVAKGQDSNLMYLKSDTSARLAKDFILMKAGIMMIYQKGDSIAMTAVMTLSDGTVVKQDGSITRKNGDTLKLKEGEGIYMNGKIKPRILTPPIKKI